MPKKMKNSSRTFRKSTVFKSRKRISTNDGSYDRDQKINTQTFRIFSAVTAASNTAATFVNTEIDLSPASWGSRGVAFADLFQTYRIVGLAVKLNLSPGMVTTATQAMYMPGNCFWLMGLYYGPSSTFTVPSSMTQMVDLPHQVNGMDNNRFLSLTVNRGDLLRHTKQRWYQTAHTGVGSELEYTQLCLEIASSPFYTTTSAADANLVIDLVVQFSGSVDPADIPLRIFKRYGILDPVLPFQGTRNDVYDEKDVIVVPSDSSSHEEEKSIGIVSPRKTIIRMPVKPPTLLELLHKQFQTKVVSAPNPSK